MRFQEYSQSAAVIGWPFDHLYLGSSVIVQVRLSAPT
jgi:hypothetical protein